MVRRTHRADASLRSRIPCNSIQQQRLFLSRRALPAHRVRPMEDRRVHIGDSAVGACRTHPPDAATHHHHHPVEGDGALRGVRPVRARTVPARHNGGCGDVVGVSFHQVHTVLHNARAHKRLHRAVIPVMVHPVYKREILLRDYVRRVSAPCGWHGMQDGRIARRGLRKACRRHGHTARRRLRVPLSDHVRRSRTAVLVCVRVQACVHEDCHCRGWLPLRHGNGFAGGLVVLRQTGVSTTRLLQGEHHKRCGSHLRRVAVV